MKKDAFLLKVERFAASEQIFRHTRQVLAAVSGGPDSVALLLLLLRLRQVFGFEVTVAHFDHKLRPQSGDDLAFVRELSARLGVPFLSGEGEVAQVAQRQRAGIEETARKMRYQFLGFIAAEKRMDCVATGHTADDQVETVLMRVLRGSGVRGIRGMLPVTDLPGGSAQRLVRPLLRLTRAETAAVCADAGIEPLRDPSNDELAPLRNRIRHQALPVLEAVNPSVRDSLLGLAASAREAFADIERKSLLAVPRQRGPVGAIYALDALAVLPNEALTLVLEREASFFNLELELNRTRIENLRQVLRAGAGTVAFGDLAVQASCGQVRLGPPLAAEPFDGKVLNIPGVTLAGPWRVEVATSPHPATAGATVAAIDSGAVQGVLRVRVLAPGDRFRYHGIERKVADALANAKLPAWERIGVLVIADAHTVHAALAATTTFEADRPPDADLYSIRVSQATPPQPQGPGLQLPR
ncbi:MAG: tRNA lysidine(34) synthetase TilS [Chloroflexi bacterium]|nr:tRNA lysidine(34) synthetase TilS [Chloroflexota bacterium]